MIPTECVHGIMLIYFCAECRKMAQGTWRGMICPSCRDSIERTNQVRSLVRISKTGNCIYCNKEKPMNEAGAAYELAVRWTHAKYAVVRALSFWETWVVAASVAYLMARFAPWAAHGFRVVGR